MIVKLLTEHHLEFLSLKGGYKGSSESIHLKMPHCWKFHALAQFMLRWSWWRTILKHKSTIVLLYDKIINVTKCIPYCSRDWRFME